MTNYLYVEMSNATGLKCQKFIQTCEKLNILLIWYNHIKVFSININLRVLIPQLSSVRQPTIKKNMSASVLLTLQISDIYCFGL